MSKFFSIEQSIRCILQEISHDGFKAEIGITLGHPSEILTILISKRIEDKSYYLIHSLGVCDLWMFFEIEKDDAGQAIIVISSIPILHFRKMNI